MNRATKYLMYLQLTFFILTMISIAVLPLAIKIYTDLYGIEGFSITGEMLATQSIFAILGIVCLNPPSRKSFKLYEK